MKYALVQVSVPHRNVDRPFHYIIPDVLKDKLSTGMRVYVPFGRGNRRTEGYILDFSDESDVPEDKLKTILDIHEDYSILSDRGIALGAWMSKKYYTTFNECLYCIAPKAVKDKVYSCASLNPDNPDLQGLIEAVKKRKSRQTQVLELFHDDAEIPVSHIKSILDIDNAPINALVKKGILKITGHRQYRGNVIPVKPQPIPTLTREQEAVIATILKENRPVLLHGVTGSGKTEVYLRLIDRVLKEGKQAIVLVPEISLTPQTVSRFVARFGSRVAMTHSKMSHGERYDQWTRAAAGEIDIMIGPRSAIFTPFERLGIVIIDEEHETSYKADNSPRYDAREVGEKLRELYSCRLVLGSATPSIVSYYKAINGEYALAEMRHRVNMSLPETEICDMRQELAEGNYSIFSRSLKAALEDNLQAGKQSILFLNRRGFSSFVSCRSCGYVMTCDSCSVNYTYHKHTNSLVCHYCGKTAPLPTICPQCGSKYIRLFGMGTERIEQELSQLFPTGRVLRMDRDTTSAKGGHTAILEKFASGKADILIGTQMIAKGLDFPNVTLVGVLAADMSLNMNDYRSGEITYNLITQVAGRAGRAKDKGRVIIQTYNPTHYSIVCAKNNDYLSYFKEEISFRRVMGYPPFSHIFYILLTGEDEALTAKAADALTAILTRLNRSKTYVRLGPAPAVISRINKKYRYKIIIKCEDEERLKAYVLYCVNMFSQLKEYRKISVSLALDPNYSI